MFLFGKTIGKVLNQKLKLPKSYHLKNRRILGKWKSDDQFYLSDSEQSLNYMAGRDKISYYVKVDSQNRIIIPTEYENSTVEITGMISSIELVFHKE